MASSLSLTGRAGVVVGGPPDDVAEAGMRLLREGGNAVDAAAAAALVEAAVNPQVSGLGGSGGLVVYLAAGRRCLAVDYNARAPAATRPDVFAGVLDSMTPTRRRALRDAGWSGYQLMCVPGCVAGLELAVRAFGRKSWREVAAPALELIREGVPINERWAGTTPGLDPDEHDAAARRLLTIDGRPPRVGERLPFEPFVELFEEVAEGGADAFYRGTIARRLAAAVRSRGGMLSEDDLASYEARIVEPMAISYRGHDVFTAPPALGGVSALQALRALGGEDWGRLEPGGADWAARLADAFRIVWRDRLSRLGDTPHARAEAERLLADARGERRRGGREEERPAARGRWRGGPGTIHISAADAEGNLAALTQSLVGGGFLEPGFGLIMNQSLLLFDPRPGHPNAPGPGKQPLVNMSPTVVLKDGAPRYALGAPGARRIISVVTQVLTNLIDFGMRPADALAAGRIHAEDEGPVLVESILPDAAARGLTDRGYETERVKSVGELGSVIRCGPEGVEAAADPSPHRSLWAGRTGVVAAA